MLFRSRSLCNNIKKDEPLQLFLNQLNRNFTEDKDHGIKINGKSLTVAKLINVWFNTEFFHSGNVNQQKDRALWLTVLEDRSAQKLLFWEILQTQHTIKSLYACLKDLKRGHSNILNCPDEQLIFRQNNKQV